MDENTLLPPLPNPQPVPPLGDKEPIEYILELLAKGELTEERGRLRWSSNHTLLVSVCDDTWRTLAIYKPQRGERPLWDFPDGTLCYRERAAFLVSEALGWRIVPPTVLRDARRGLGSLQLFIEHDPEITYFNLGKSFIPQLMRIAAFDYITNNADRKGGHCLLDRQHKVWGIDHGICFHTAHKLRTVIWDYAGTPIPAAIKADIESFYQACCAGIVAMWGELNWLLSPREVEAMLRRTEHLLIQGNFPQPGHGPSYPWPPI